MFPYKPGDNGLSKLEINITSVIFYALFFPIIAAGSYGLQFAVFASQGGEQIVIGCGLLAHTIASLGGGLACTRQLEQLRQGHPL